MPVIDKFMMLQVGVSDMPKAKALYVDKLGWSTDLSSKRPNSMSNARNKKGDASRAAVS